MHSVTEYTHGTEVMALLPEWCTEDSVGCLYLLTLRCHSTEVTLMQWRVEASL